MYFFCYVSAREKYTKNNFGVSWLHANMEPKMWCTSENSDSFKNYDISETKTLYFGYKKP